MMIHQSHSDVKKCFKCNEVKPVEDFYRHPCMADGHVNKCKDCNKRDVRENRAKRIEHYREYDRARGNRQGVEYLRKYREGNPDKYHAHIMVRNHIRGGKLTRATECEECGSDSNIHAHHEDYSKPLEVVWLCAACHAKRHPK